MPQDYGLGGREFIKANNKTFGDDVYLHYLNVSMVHRSMCMLKVIQLFSLNKGILPCHVYYNNTVKLIIYEGKLIRNQIFIITNGEWNHGYISHLQIDPPY